MSGPFHKRTISVIAAVWVLFCYVLVFCYHLGITNNAGYNTNQTPYLVDTPACKIPNVDPFDSSIRRFVWKKERLICQNIPQLTYVDGLQLRINRTAADGSQQNGNIRKCVYTPIYRPKHEPTSNKYWKYLDISEPFTDYVDIADDFIKVSCYDIQGKIVYINVHAFIQPNVTVDEVLTERFKRHKDEDNIVEHPNVIMLGVDSVSRLSFLRQMTKTRRLLMESLGAVEMVGYNKVADNTFVNIVPMTVGKFVEELPWDDSMANKPFDDVTFIWKQFSGKGYRTFYAEDAPVIAIFDCGKAGFNTPPADYFNRPLSLAMESMNLWSNHNHCFQGMLETDMVLENLYDFVNTFRNQPHFAFTFLTGLTHDDVNGAGSADQSYYSFFKKLRDNGLLNNTVVVFYSDHGIRFGKLRQTHIGKLEERLPFMLMSVPKSWDKYTHIKINLDTNTRRLSTPFDVYETLRDILYFDGVEMKAENNSRAVSWFREIPIERSCDQAGILPHWCTCASHEKLKTTDKLAIQSSGVVLRAIVQQLSNFTAICEDVSLLEIKEATRLVTSDKILKFKRKTFFDWNTKSFEDVQVLLVTSPGNAIFEATVRVDTVTNTYTLVGDISRINKYGNSADCISNFKLKKFCQCRLGESTSVAYHSGHSTDNGTTN